MKIHNPTFDHKLHNVTVLFTVHCRLFVVRCSLFAVATVTGSAWFDVVEFDLIYKHCLLVFLFAPYIMYTFTHKLASK